MVAAPCVFGTNILGIVGLGHVLRGCCGFNILGGPCWGETGSGAFQFTLLVCLCYGMGQVCNKRHVRILLVYFQRETCMGSWSASVIACLGAVFLQGCFDKSGLALWSSNQFPVNSTGWAVWPGFCRCPSFALMVFPGRLHFMGHGGAHIQPGQGMGQCGLHRRGGLSIPYAWEHAHSGLRGSWGPGPFFWGLVGLTP